MIIRILLSFVMIVISIGNSDAMQLFLDLFEEPNEYALDKYSLHEAIDKDDKNRFDELLEDPSTDINAYNLERETPLHIAASLCKRDYYIERLVKDRRIDICKKNKRQRNALEDALYWFKTQYEHDISFGFAESLSPIITLAKSIYLKERIDQKSYYLLSLIKSENVNNIEFLVRSMTNQRHSSSIDSLIYLIAISTGWDDIRYDQNTRLLIDVPHGCRVINLLLIQHGHQLNIKTNTKNFCDRNGMLLIDQALNNNQYYIAAKLLDYGSPMPTSTTDKEEIIPRLKNVYLCADEQDFAEKRQKMSISTLNFVRAQQLGKQAVSRYKRMHKTNDRIQKKEAHLQIL